MKPLVLTLFLLLACTVGWLFLGRDAKTAEPIHGGRSPSTPWSASTAAELEALGAVPGTDREVVDAALEIAALVEIDAPTRSAPAFALVIEGPIGREAVRREQQVRPGELVRQSVDGSGRYFVHAAAPGWTCDPQWVRVRHGETAAPVRLTATAGSQLSGRIVDERGAPVENADVRLIYGMSASPQGTTSDAGGRFQIAVPDEDRAPRLLVLAQGFQPARPQIDELDAEARIELDRGWTVTGRVLDEDDRPVADAALRFEPRGRRSAYEQRWFRTSPVHSDALGRFELRGIIPGVGAVFANHPKYAQARARLLPGSARELVLRLTSGVAIVGILVSEEDQPLPHGEVKLVPEAGGVAARVANTEVDGGFRFEGVPAGQYRLQGHLPGYAPSVVRIEAPQSEPIAIRLTRPAQLIGEVWTAEAPRYTVDLHDLEGRRLVSEVFEDTHFELEDLPAGHVSVSVTVQGAAREQVAIVTLIAGEATDLGPVVLTGGSQVTGQVVYPSGQPLPARCYLSRMGIGGALERVGNYEAGPDGRFVFSGIRAGRYSLLVAPSDAAHRTVDDIRVDGTTDLDLGLLEVASGATLEVLVLGRDGEPLAGTGLTVGDGKGGYSGRTDASGRFRRSNLRPGYCSAGLLVDGVPHSVRGTSRAGETTELILSLQDVRHSTWSARLLDPGGRPRAGSSVVAVAEDGTWRSCDSTTDSDGRFSLRGRLEGRAVLEVWGLRDGFPPVSLLIEFGGPGEGPAEVQLPRGSLRGAVPDEQSTLRLVQVDWAQPASASYRRRRGELFASVTGAPGDAFELPFLVGGRYRLEWLDDEGDVLDAFELELAEGENRKWTGPPLAGE